MLTSCRTLVLLGFVVGGVLGCSDATPSLEVRLVTGLVAGPEFSVVQTSVLSSSTTGRHVLDAAETRASVGDDYAHGLRVASLALNPAQYLVRVRLLRRDGSILAENTAALTLVGNTVLPIHITRDCVGVMCPSPSGSADLLACLGGRCVDPRCSSNAPEYCPEIAFCHDGAECGGTATCATTNCIDGLCVEAPVENACMDDEWCDPDASGGCMALVPVENPDDIVCNTICTLAETPCEFGYWKCSDDASPVCDALIRRPSGTVCGPGRTCDTEGACIVDAGDVPAIFVEPTSALAISEAGTFASFAVVLGAAPTASVTIPLRSSAEASVLPTSLTFDATSWDTPQIVAVTAVDDDVDDGDVAFFITTDAAVSADTRYNGMDALDVSGTCADDDISTVSLTPIVGLTTTELGGTATFEVRLTSRPSNVVSLMLTSSNTAEGTVGDSSLSFTAANWNIAQTVTLTGVDDALLDGTAHYSVITSDASSEDPNYDGIPVDDVMVDNLGVLQRTFFKASNAGENNTFGAAVAMSADGNTIAVAAPNEESNAVGVNGNELDDSSPYAGAVYVFARSGGVWTQQAYVKASNTDMNDNFGHSLALSDDGNTLAVGSFGESSGATGIDGDQVDDSAFYAGAAYVFTRSGTTWTQQSYIKPSNTEASDRFGTSMSLSATGDTLCVTADFERSNAVGIGGSELDNSAFGAGAAYVFTRAASVWSQQAYIKASNTGSSDFFGHSVSLSDDGNTLAVGAPGEASNATGIGGTQIDDSAASAGAVYVFTRTGSVWMQQAYVKASNTDAGDSFGGGVALASDGDTLAVSATGEASNSAGVNGDEANDSLSYAGAAFVFTRTAGSWSQRAYVKASNPGANDSFGQGIALSGDGSTLAVGAYYEQSNARGVDGDQSDNSAMYCGATYVFGLDGATWTQRAYVKAANALPGDAFGASVALDSTGTMMSVGAIDRTVGTAGIGGEEDGGSYFSGAIYSFRLK